MARQQRRRPWRRRWRRRRSASPRRGATTAFLLCSSVDSSALASSGRSVGRLCVPLGCCCRLRYAALSCCTLHSAPLSFAGSFARLLACLTPTLYASGCEFLWPSEAETDCTAALLACLPAPGRLIRQVRAPRLPSAPHHHPHSACRFAQLVPYRTSSSPTHGCFYQPPCPHPFPYDRAGVFMTDSPSTSTLLPSAACCCCCRDPSTNTIVTTTTASVVTTVIPPCSPQPHNPYGLVPPPRPLPKSASSFLPSCRRRPPARRRPRLWETLCFLFACCCLVLLDGRGADDDDDGSRGNGRLGPTCRPRDRQTDIGQRQQ